MLAGSFRESEECAVYFLQEVSKLIPDYTTLHATESNLTLFISYLQTSVIKRSRRVEMAKLV